MDIKNIKIEDLKFANYNPRKISDTQFAKLRQSINEFGFVEPVVVNSDNTVIGGHMRTRAAKAEGLVEVPCYILNIDKQKEKLLNLALNRVSGEWDEDKLAELIYGLNDEGADVSLSGFEDDEVSIILDSVAGINEDDFDADQEVEQIGEPESKLGEIYELGPHRLMCGDSIEKEDVEKLMNGKKADMVFTDPPWNVAIGLDSNPRHRQREGLINDNLGADFPKFLSDVAISIEQFNDGDTYCVMGYEEWPTIHKALTGVGLHWSATVIWAKDMFVLGRSKYHRRYEPIWYGWKDKSSYCGDRKQDDLWEIKRPKRIKEHPTMKPIELCAKAIQNSSKHNDIVLDLFGGSGSTLIACEQLNRKSYLMELDPKYCDVIRKRYKQYKENE